MNRYILKDISCSNLTQNNYDYIVKYCFRSKKPYQLEYEDCILCFQHWGLGEFIRNVTSIRLGKLW